MDSAAAILNGVPAKKLAFLQENELDFIDTLLQNDPESRDFSELVLCASNAQACINKMAGSPAI